MVFYHYATVNEKMLISYYKEQSNECEAMCQYKFITN